MRVGLVGAGQWARTFHAPLHSSGFGTELSGVWSPNPDRAASLASAFGVRAFATFDELVDASEAVDFAVPPAVQASLATEAAGAGRALLLEKPLAVSLEAAERVVAAIEAAGVVSAVILTKRYHRRTREFLADAQALGGVIAATGRYVHGGFLETGFLEESGRTGWRQSLGALFDLGPHLLDLADAAAGRILSILATGDPAEAILLSTEHAGGAAGQFLLSGRVRTDRVLTDLDIYSNEGRVGYSTAGLDLGEAAATLGAEFAAAVRSGAPVAVDARRALAVQRMIDAASRSLTEGRAIELEPR